ncbi:hypothetical protein B0T19DRAFT_441057 [Cercophora scortea]|uniref:Carrier domain-containing protein n=1 Tax=Cercophora scortea TaxID=314031 RepID=A0AAE0MC15_9PEZI|nr:hypothetical protein B0T19DRAFT_441057 [Cercophora scortea]
MRAIKFRSGGSGSGSTCSAKAGKSRGSFPAAAADDNTTAAKTMAMVAAEAGIEPSELHHDAAFSNLGVVSLMSLVIAERFREQLGIAVNGSLFLEFPTVGDLRSWLVEYYS